MGDERRRDFANPEECSHSCYEWIRYDDHYREKICSMCGKILETKQEEKR